MGGEGRATEEIEDNLDCTGYLVFKYLMNYLSSVNNCFSILRWLRWINLFKAQHGNDEFRSNNFCLVMNHPHALLFSFVKQITHVMLLDLFPLISI
jgi:hypothetical protein